MAFASQRRTSSRLLAPGLLLLAAMALLRPAFIGGAPGRLRVAGRSAPAADAARGHATSRAARGGEATEALKAGDEVEAVFPDDGTWYPGVVETVNEDGSFDVKWADPDGGPEVSTVSADDIKRYVPPIALDELVIGQKYQGTIEGVAPFGAFVNFGAESTGLVHISAIKEGFVDNIEDEVEVGQEVDVWVKQVRDGKVGLVMVESKLGGGGGGGGGAPREAQDFTPFQDVAPEEELEGEIVGVRPFGAFVKVRAPGGAEAQGMCHISELSDEFVDDINSLVEVGQQVKVRVTSVDLERGRMSLSMKSIA